MFWCYITKILALNNFSTDILPKFINFKGHKNISKKEFQIFKQYLTETDLTISPRLIRIQYYRFLFARNLWIALYKNSEFPSEQFLVELFNNSEKSVFKRNGRIEYILEMVKAY